MSHWNFYLTISDILGYHNQRWPRNLYFKLFLSIYLLQKLIVIWGFYINMCCVQIKIYWSKTYLPSLKESIVLVSLFKTSLSNDILASVSDFEFQEAEDFDYIQMYTVEICSLGGLLLNFKILLLKVYELWFFVISEINSGH